MKKPIVYVASAYTRGDPAVNTHFQCRVFDELMNDGVVWPVVPLWSHFQHTLFPRQYRDWIEYDKAMIASGAYDACLRLVARCSSIPDYEIAESSGADGEVELFRQMQRPVFFNKETLYEWASR